MSPSIQPAMTVIEYKEKAAAGVRWEDAPMIVDVGQGMKDKSDLVIAEELAALFDGQVACTPPCFLRTGLVPRMVGTIRQENPCRFMCHTWVFPAPFSMLLASVIPRPLWP